MSRKAWISGAACVAVVGAAGLLVTVSTQGKSAVAVGAQTSGAGPHVGGSININASPHGPWADVFNPYSPGENQNDIVPDIYEPLVQWNGTNGVSKPWLASSWSWSKLNTVLTVNLRKGVTWSNGKPFTSTDVVFTFNMLKQNPSIDGNALWTYMKSITKVNPYTVRVTLTKPNSTFFYYFSGTLIVPEFAYQGVNPVKFADAKPVGTGPFVLSQFNPQQITLTRNPHYWQKGLPYLQTVNYPAETSNDSTILGLATGQVDWATIFSPSLKTSFVAKDPTNHKVNTVFGGFDALYLNTTVYPLNMPVVRQAISLAIDRHALSAIGESGYSTPAALNGVGASMGANWSTPALQQKYASKYNAAQAKSMLIKAGFKVGSDGMLLTPKGKPFTLTLDVPAPFSDFVTMSSQIKTMLTNIGINTTEDSTSANQYYNRLQMGTFQAGICWTPSGPTPFYTQNGLLNSAYTAPVGKSAPGMNFSRYTDATANKLIAQYYATEDKAKQKTLSEQLGGIMATQLPAIPLLDRNAPVEYSTKNIAGWPTASDPYWHDASYSGPIVVLTHLYSKNN